MNNKDKSVRYPEGTKGVVSATSTGPASIPMPAPRATKNPERSLVVPPLQRTFGLNRGAIVFSSKEAEDHFDDEMELVYVRNPSYDEVVLALKRFVKADILDDEGKGDQDIEEWDDARLALHVIAGRLPKVEEDWHGND